MPIKSRKPNLFRDEVDYLTDDAFVRDIDKRFGGRQDQPEPEIEDDRFEITKGFAAGWDQTQALAGGAYAALGSLFGQEEWVNDGLDYYQEQMNEASEYAPAVSFEDDWEGVGDFTDWLAYTVGNVVPSLATTLAGGGIGGFLAKQGVKASVKSEVNKRVKDKFEKAAKDAAEAQATRLTQNQYRDTVLRRYGKSASGVARAEKASRRGALGTAGFVSSTLGTGENFTRIYEETGLEDPAAALSLGIAMGALDVIGAPMRAFDRMFPGESKDQLKSFLSDAAITDRGRVRKMFDAVSNPKGRLGAARNELVVGAVREGITEATQEWLSRTSVLWAKENLPEDQQEQFIDYLSSEDAMSSYIHAGVVGIVGGSTAGSALGLAAGPKQPKERFDINEAQQKQQVHTAQREAAAEEYDKGPVPEQEAQAQPVVDRESLLQTVLGQVSSKNDIRVEEIARNTGIDIPQTQEILDTLEEQEFIFSDIDQDGSIYNINDDADIPDTLTQADVVAEPEPEISVSAEETPAPTTPVEEVVEAEPVADRQGRVEPTVSPAPEETISPQEQAAEEPTMRVSDPTAKPTDKRDPDYDSNGEVILTFPDGDVRRIYQDIDTKVWYDTEEQNNIYDSGIELDGETAKTKKNAIAGIIEKRQREFDEFLENFDDGAETTTATPSEPTQRRNRDNENQFIIEFPDSGNTYTIEQRGEGDQAEWFNVDTDNPIGFTREELIEQLKTTERLSSMALNRLDVEDPPIRTTLSGERASGRDLTGMGVQSGIPLVRREDNEVDVYNQALGEVAGPDGPTVNERINALNQNEGQTVQQKEGDDELTVQRFGGNYKLVGHLKGRPKRKNGRSQGRPTKDQPSWVPEGIPKKELKSLLEEYGITGGLDDAPPQLQEYMHGILEVIERGIPVEWAFGNTGVYINDDDSGLASYYINEKAIGVKKEFLESAVTDPAQRRYLTHAIAHEIFHYADYKNGYTEKYRVKRLSDGTFVVESSNVALESLKIQGSKMDGDRVTVDMGDVTAEIYDLWANYDEEIGAQFAYPLNGSLDRMEQAHRSGSPEQIDNVETFLRKEMFAQLGAVYIDNPKGLKQKAPKSYAMIRSILMNPNLTSEEVIFEDSNITEAVETGDRPVLQDVRTPTIAGSGEVSDTGRAGPDGIGRDLGGTTSEGMGGETTTADGDTSGLPVREGPNRLDITDQQRYLYQKSKGNVSGKFAVTKLLNETNAEQQLPLLEELVSRHPNVLEKGASWLAFERDLTGTNETLRPPYALIELFNNMDQWVETHGRLSEEQIVAAREGLDTAKELGDLYESGVATPRITSKLMLWGMMSRMLTASAQEAGFVDLLTSLKGENANRTEQFIDSALEGIFTDQDVADWREFVPTAIKEGSFGRAGTSNANDFGSFLKKMSERDSDGVVKLQKLHDLIADRSIPSSEVRRQFQGMTSSPGIGNKVFSFLLLMSGRNDVVVLDRIQLNTMWDSGRYGKLIYDDIAMNFEGQHGLARYEVLENALKQKIGELYQRLGRGDEGSVGRYHWESWVLNSGQVVAHPTMRGLVADAKGEQAPYAFLGAPEGRQNQYRYGAIYARDADGEQYIMYPDSEGTPYKFSPKQFASFIDAIQKRGTGILPKDFKVSDYNKGFPWYEAEGVDRQKLDEQIRAYAEREALEREYGVEETTEVEDVSDGSGQRVGSPNVLGIEDPTPSFNAVDETLTALDAETRLQRKIRTGRQKVVDRLEGLKRLEDIIAERIGLERLPSELSAYDAENLMHSKVQKQLEEFEVEHVEPIADLVKSSGLTIDQVGLYLLAKHAPERNQRMFEKEQELRARQMAALERDLENTEVQDPEGSPAIRQKIEDLEAAPFRFEDNGSGMTYAQAASVIEQAEADGKTEQLEAVSTRIYEMLNQMRDNMVKKGLLDEETRADWEDTYQFYVPLKGFASYAEGLEIKGSPKAAGFSIRGSESFKARGRVTLPVNPLLVSFKDAEEKIVRAEKNQIAQRLLTMLSKNKDKSLWSIWNNRNRPDSETRTNEKMTLDEMKRERRKDDGLYKYIQVKRGGQTFFIEIKDRELNRQLQTSGVGMFNNTVDFMNRVLTGLQKFQNFRRNMLINYNPSWGLVNPLRDIQTGLAFALSEQDVAGGRIKNEELIGKIALGYKQAGFAFMRYRRGKEGATPEAKEYDKYAREYVEDGAPTGLSVSKSLEEQQKRFETIVKQGSFRKKLKAAGKLVEDFNQTMENSVRLSTYVEARKAGVSRADAATLAKDLTVNFNRKGEYSSAIDSLYLFFNAAVQGNVNIAKALLREGSEGQKITKARALAATMVVWGFARTVFNIMNAGMDDDDEPVYKDYNEYALRTGMLFAFEGQGVAMPMPYGWGIFDNLGRYGAEFVYGIKSPGETALNVASALDHHFNPISLHASKDGAGVVDAALQKGLGLFPDVFEVGLELYGNINFFGGDIKVPQNAFLTPKPESVPTKRGTNEVISGITQFINYATAPDGTPNVEKYRSGVDVNPEQVQHVYEFLLGGVGRFFDDTSDTIAKMVSEDKELRTTDLPILRTFLPLPSEYSDRVEFYRNRDSFRQYRDQHRDATPADRAAIEAELGTKVFEFNLQDKAANKTLRELSEEKKSLENNTLMDPVVRIEAIRRNAEMQEAVFDKYNRNWEKVKP